MRINIAKDDAAGLAISERFTAQIRGLNQGVRNANDAISLSQTAEGALGEITSNFQRIRELAVQSASDTVSDIEREFTNREYSQLVDEIDRISNSTEFSGVKLLQVEDEVQIHVGKGDGSQENSDRVAIDVAEMATSSESLNVSGTEITSRDTAIEQLAVVDEALQQVASNRATIGAKQNRLNSTMSSEILQECR